MLRIYVCTCTYAALRLTDLLLLVFLNMQHLFTFFFSIFHQSSKTYSPTGHGSFEQTTAYARPRQGLQLLNTI